MNRTHWIATLVALNLTAHAGALSAQDRRPKRAATPARAHPLGPTPPAIVAEPDLEPESDAKAGPRPPTAPDFATPPPSDPGPTEAPRATEPTTTGVTRVITTAAPTVDEEDSRHASEPLAPSNDAVDHSLLGYGAWRDDPTLGRIWVPSPECVGKGFTPFVTGGHWTLDGPNYRWNNLYPWGDATFHYGNWVWKKGLGWAWVPGTEYAPARVVWRPLDSSRNVVGWAPLPLPSLSDRGAPLPFHFVRVEDLFDRDLASRVRRYALPTPHAQALTRRVQPDAAQRTRSYRCSLVTDHPKTWRCGYE